MPPLMLKTLRFFIPAGMLYFILVAICWYSYWCELAIPRTYEEITKTIGALILGFVYNVSYLRELSNKYYFRLVNSNLVRHLTAPFQGDPNVPQGLTWGRVRHAFYHFIDKDKSLEHQKGLAYWNGALWTSSADLRAISAIACIVTAGLMLGANLAGDTNFDSARALPISFSLPSFFS
jgi:hypothetical protein